jgi:hypothetical protein
MADRTRPPTALYFTTVIVLEPELALLGGLFYSDGLEPTATRVMGVQGGKWGKLLDVEDVVYAMEKKPAPTGKPRPTTCVLGRKGTYVEKVSGTPPLTVTVERKDAGYFHDLRWIGTHLYACGTQNIVQRQEKDGRWVRSDQGTFSPLKDYVTRAFHSIAGADDNEIVAVGLGGAIWLWDGKAWSQQPSPTNYPLHAILRASSGEYYIGGTQGLLWKGNPSKGWTSIGDPAVSTQTIEDMTEFQGKIYLAVQDKLLVTDGGPVTEVSVPVQAEKAFFAMDSVPGALWVAGDESVLQFDGTTWKRHVCPENQ